MVLLMVLVRILRNRHRKVRLSNTHIFGAKKALYFNKALEILLYINKEPFCY
jgi:hypothetical protein